MTQRPEDGGKLRGYLLGSIPEEESAELERRYFEDDALFEELLAEETEVLDDYASGSLTNEERRRFEKLLETSPRLRKRSALAKTMLRLERRSGRLAPLAALLVAAGIVLAVGTLWVVRTSQRPSPAGAVAVNRQSPAPVVPLPTAPPVSGTPLPAGPGRSSTDGRPGAHVVSFVLAAGLTRSTSATPLLSIPPDTTAVELRLPLEADEHPAYSAELQASTGTEVLTRRGLRARKENDRRVVVLEVPAGKLSAGEYLVTLSGEKRGGPAEALGQYAFRLARE